MPDPESVFCEQLDTVRVQLDALSRLHAIKPTARDL
jgi:hypothetical protein